MNQEDTIIVGSVSDDPFAIDVARFFGQKAEISDIIALKNFANGEFCPRFIFDENDFDRVGTFLEGKTVGLVSTCCATDSRDDLAMRNLLVARAAKDNGAALVILVEPDLFYSAQDRGPRREHGDAAFGRDLKDLKKFDGQPFSSLLYAQLLRTAGVDAIMTVHNHSVSVERVFSREFKNRYYNLSPAKLYAHYLSREDYGTPGPEGKRFVFCSPDSGAAPFAHEMRKAMMDMLAAANTRAAVDLLLMDKVRTGERKVAIQRSPQSPTGLEDISGATVIVFDDMIRTGYTIVECCRVLKQAGAKRVVFIVTHFYSSDEVKENLSTPTIDEIITTNSLPGVLNRDMQGRLRRKMLVLKIEKWMARFLQCQFHDRVPPDDEFLYSIDISTKNPRWRPSHELDGADPRKTRVH